MRMLKVNCKLEDTGVLMYGEEGEEEDRMGMGI